MARRLAAGDLEQRLRLVGCLVFSTFVWCRLIRSVTQNGELKGSMEFMEDNYMKLEKENSSPSYIITMEELIIKAALSSSKMPTLLDESS